MPSDTDQANAGMPRIDLDDPASVERWTKELSVTAMQLREAVAAVGNRASDVELHLKGTRSSTDGDMASRL